MRHFKRYFITGLLIWIPLVITLWVLSLVFTTLESVVPSFLTSQSLFGVRIPGFQLLLVLVVGLLFFAGRVLWANGWGQLHWSGVCRPLGTPSGQNSAGAFHL